MELKHVAFIPDGNRRYARKLGIDFSRAYELGFRKAREVLVDWRPFLEKYGVREVTFWGLSTENLQRSPAELEIIFSYMRRFLKEVLEEDLNSYRIGVKFVGDLSRIPGDIRGLMAELEKKTQEFKGFREYIAVAYGGRNEILGAAKRLAESGLEFTEKNLERFLYIPSYPDLVIRTSGTVRTSGFMPWQTAYSEWYFSSKLWPEFDIDEMKKAIDDYFSRERRFGR